MKSVSCFPHWYSHNLYASEPSVKMLYVFKMCFGQRHPAYFKYLKFLKMYLFYVLPYSTLILSWPLPLVCSIYIF